MATREDVFHLPLKELGWVNPRDKHRRNVGFNPCEASQFCDICMHGPQQIIECYQCYDRDLSTLDIMYLCSRCKHSRNAYYSADILPLLSRARLPFFIDDIVEVVDTETETPGYFVYFVSDGEFVKIGIAKDVQKRLSGIQTGNPKPVSVLFSIPVRSKRDALELEYRLHNIYSNFAKCGEWFDILNYIDVKEFQKFCS